MSRTPNNPGARGNVSTPLGQPFVTTTSPTPSPRHHALGPSHLPSIGPGSPRLNRIVPQRMSSGSSDRDGSPGIGSPRRQTLVVGGFSPGSTASPLPSVAENGTPDRRLIPGPRTSLDQAFTPAGTFYGSPGRSPRGLIPELPSYSRRNSAAISANSGRAGSRSGTPRIGNGRGPSSRNTSGQATPNRTSRTVTPRDGSSQGNGHRLVQMGSGSVDEADPWTPNFDQDSGDESWTAPNGGILLGDDDNAGRSWTSLDEQDQLNSHATLLPGDRFGEGLKFQGERIRAAIGQTYGHDIVHALRRGGSEMGVAGRNGPVGAGPTDGRTRQRTVYEVVRVAGQGSFAQVYHIRELAERRREYALKVIARPSSSGREYDDQTFEATVHLSLPIHTNIVTLHETLQTSKWIFMLLEWCPGEDLFYWLENNRLNKPAHTHQQGSSAESAATNNHLLSSSRYSSSVIPFSPGAMFTGLAAQHPMASSLSSSIAGSPYAQFAPASNAYGNSPAASMILAHHNHSSQTPQGLQLGQTPPTPTLLSAFSPNTLLLADRLRLIASMFSQMCEAVAVCHETGISHRDIKPENFICCDSVELETVAEHQARASTDNSGQIRLQAKRKVIVKLTDFGLATTDYESQDMSCGSKPYMSYECRNGHVGPSYRPAPADVWSLGVVLLNMIFHRACWKDPTDEDPKFAQYQLGPRRYLINQFPGIGNQVASFLADHVLCIDVGDRVSARDFGRWVRNLPEMIAGRTAVKEMKHTVKAIRAEEDRGLFAKSPIVRQGSRKTKTSTSALTTTAPNALGSYQGLSSLPPPSQMASDPAPAPETVPAEATSIQPTLADPIDRTSPDPSESHTSPIENHDSEANDAEGHDGAQDDANPSTQKKKKRGARRKGKATQAALAAEKTEPEREALLAELADASQSLARDLSKTHIPRVDTRSPEQFPPLGTSDAQIAESRAAQANRSKGWREKLSFSSTSHNPQLAAFARRVAEREAGGQDVKGGFGNWSAPAKMQDDHRVQLAGRPAIKHTTTMSTSGVASQLSSFGGFGAVSSATSSGIEEEPEELKVDEKVKAEDDESAKAKEAEEARANKAIQAATLLSSNLGSMGSFGQRPQHVPRHGPLHGKNMANAAAVPIKQPKVEPKAKPAAVVIAPSAPRQTVQTPNILTPSTASALKSPVTATQSRSAASTIPSLVRGSSNGSSVAPTAPSATNSMPPPPVERPGKFKERVQVLGNILRGVNLSNKKD